MVKELFILIGMFLNLVRVEIEMNIIYLIEWMKKKYDNTKDNAINIFTNGGHHRVN